MACRSEKWVPALFSAWEAAGIKYVVLRNYEKLPADTGNDLDLLVDPVRIRVAEQILIRVMNERGGILHNRAEFSPVSLFFHDPLTKEQFHVDLFRDLKWRGFDLLRPEKVLDRSIRYNGMSIPSPADESILNLLTRLVFGGYVKEKYKLPVRDVFLARAEETKRGLQMVLGPLGLRIWQQVERKEFGAIEKQVHRIRGILILRSVCQRPLQTAGEICRDAGRLIARWVRTPGLSIVLMGPDGCGKTSVGTALKKRLAGTFYEEYVHHLHWKPRLMKKMADAAVPFGIPCTDPHGKPARNPVVNILYFLAHSLEIPPAWLLRVRPRLFRNMLVMIDRYYYDFMVDSKRYRMNVSEKWAWFMYRFMPKPDLVFCLTAPTEVIQARKQEVSAEETERQRLAYEKVACQLPYGHVIDTNRPLNQVVDEVESVVLKQLSERAAKRIKK